MSAFQGSLQQVCSCWYEACLLMYRIIKMHVTSQAATLAELFINGGDLQDCHEFLCALLEQLQAEVVRREVRFTPRAAHGIPLHACSDTLSV